MLFTMLLSYFFGTVQGISHTAEDRKTSPANWKKAYKLAKEKGEKAYKKFMVKAKNAGEKAELKTK